MLHIFLISFRSSCTFLRKHEVFPEAATHFLKHKKYVLKQLHKFWRLLHKHFQNLSKLWKTSEMGGCKNLFRNPTVLYEYYQSTHNTDRNRQIIRVCFARMSPCLHHGPYSLHSWPCQYLLINCLFLSLQKHPGHVYSAENTNHHAFLKHLYSYIYFFWPHFEQVALRCKPHTPCAYKFRLK